MPPHLDGSIVPETGRQNKSFLPGVASVRLFVIGEKELPNPFSYALAGGLVY